MSAGPWSAAQRILCVRLDALGDVLMTTPALRALKMSLPHRHLTLLTSSLGAEVAALVPEIDEVMVYDPPWMKATPPLPDADGEYAMAERLRRKRFDAAVIFTVFTQSPLPAALLCHLAGIPRRLAHCRENPYQLLTEWVPDREALPEVRHEVERQLDLVAAVGCRTGNTSLSLGLPAGTRTRLLERLRERGLHRDLPWVVVHPGASAPSRRYPADLFAEAMRLLVQQHGCRLIFTGSGSEGPLIDEIRTQVPGHTWSLAGELNVAELAALIDLATVVVCNNTGPAHIAAARGTPVVDLYALTNPQHTPWRVESRVLYHDVPCRGCLKSVCPQGHHDCLRRVAPQAVAAATGELLAMARARHAASASAS